MTDMNRKYTIVALVAGTLLVLTAIKSSAISTIYAVNFNSSVSIGSEAISSSNPPGSGIAFFIDDGQNFAFDIFSVSAPNTANPVDSTISATINLIDNPTLAIVRSVTFDGNILFGQSQFGEIVWTTPAQTFMDDGIAFPSGERAQRTYSVDLSDGLFAPGNFLNLNTAPITLTVTQISSSISVPDTGSTAMLLAFSLLGIVLAKNVSARQLLIRTTLKRFDRPKLTECGTTS